METVSIGVGGKIKQLFQKYPDLHKEFINFCNERYGNVKMCNELFFYYFVEFITTINPKNREKVRNNPRFTLSENIKSTAEYFIEREFETIPNEYRVYLKGIKPMDKCVFYTSDDKLLRVDYVEMLDHYFMSGEERINLPMHKLKNVLTSEMLIIPHSVAVDQLHKFDNGKLVVNISEEKMVGKYLQYSMIEEINKINLINDIDIKHYILHNLIPNHNYDKLDAIETYKNIEDFYELFKKGDSLNDFNKIINIISKYLF